MIRNSMTRLHAEIARSISFFRAQQGGNQPERVFLSGGSSTLPYMREFFQEKFQLPVEFFNPLRNVAVGSGLNIDEIGKNAHRMGELVGLALRGTSDCPMELNLRPARVVRRHDLAAKRPYLVIGGLCALLAMAAWWLYFLQATKVTEEATEKLAPKITELKKYETAIEKAKADIKAQQDTAQPFLAAVNEKTYWVEIIEDINSRLPREFVWVTNFDLQKPGAATAPGSGAGQGGNKKSAGGPSGTVLMLKGLYLFNTRQAGVVDDFKNKLKESPYYTVDEEHIVRTNYNDQDWAYEFDIPLILKNPIVGATNEK
jgi:Tfp pilus assembly protein PilN